MRSCCIMRPLRTTLVLQCVCLLIQSQDTVASVWKNWMSKEDAEQESPAVFVNDLPESLYGVDVSFPTHHHDVTTLQNPLADARQAFYEDYVEGCRRYFKDHRCDKSEKHRIAMNLNQPSSVSQNFTSLGFAKIRAPLALRQPLYRFWDHCVHEVYEVEERWPGGDTYTNQWIMYSYVCDINDDEIRGGGVKLKRDLMEAARPVLEEWSGVSLSPASIYGIRLFINGSVVAPHVDQAPLVISAIVNVGQDQGDPWPIEMIGHDGKAYNLTLDPGDMLLYEGQSVIHGRPYMLNAKYAAVLYLHFEPFGYSEHLEDQEAHESKGDGNAGTNSLKDLYNAALNRKNTEKTTGRILPDYIVGGSEEEPRWKQQFVYEKVHHKTADEINDELGQTSAHKAAAAGDLKRLKKVASKDPRLLHKEDTNGWRPLHEAARSGVTNVIEYLVESGADVNERTNEGKGATPLWWAEQFHDEDHPAVQLLRRLGGELVGPEL